MHRSCRPVLNLSDTSVAPADGSSLPGWCVPAPANRVNPVLPHPKHGPFAFAAVGRSQSTLSRGLFCPKGDEIGRLTLRQ